METSKDLRDLDLDLLSRGVLHIIILLLDESVKLIIRDLITLIDSLLRERLLRLARSSALLRGGGRRLLSGRLLRGGSAAVGARDAGGVAGLAKLLDVLAGKLLVYFLTVRMNGSEDDVEDE